MKSETKSKEHGGGRTAKGHKTTKKKFEKYHVPDTPPVDSVAMLVPIPEEVQLPLPTPSKEMPIPVPPPHATTPGRVMSVLENMDPVPKAWLYAAVIGAIL